MKTDSRKGVVLFNTIDALFRLERDLNALGISCKAIAVPRMLSSDCGSALSFPVEFADRVRAEIERMQMTECMVVFYDD